MTPTALPSRINGTASRDFMPRARCAGAFARSFTCTEMIVPAAPRDETPIRAPVSYDAPPRSMQTYPAIPAPTFAPAPKPPEPPEPQR